MSVGLIHYSDVSHPHLPVADAEGAAAEQRSDARLRRPVANTTEAVAVVSMHQQLSTAVE